MREEKKDEEEGRRKLGKTTKHAGARHYREGEGHVSMQTPEKSRGMRGQRLGVERKSRKGRGETNRGKKAEEKRIIYRRAQRGKNSWRGGRVYANRRKGAPLFNDQNMGSRDERIKGGP